MISTTARSLKYLRDLRWHAKKVERWNAFAKKRDDLWGADIIAVHPDINYPILVQVTSVANVSTRQRKIEGIPEIKMWLRFGGVIVQGWKKDRKTKRWTSVRRSAILNHSTGKIEWTENKNGEVLCHSERTEDVQAKGNS